MPRLWILLVSVLAGCPEGPIGHRQWQCVWAGEGRPDYLYEVGCDADFQALAGDPLTPFFGNTDSVKFAIDLHDHARIHYFDSVRWPLHWNFCFDELSRPGDEVPDHATFNQREYWSEDRRFLLGSLQHYRASGIRTLEFAAGDEISGAQIEFAYRTVVRTAYFGGELFFRPTSVAMDARTAGLDIPRIGTDEVFEGQTYQPLNEGETYGYVRIVRDGELADAFLGPRDLAVLDSVPNDISVVAGLVTSEFQAPLSHVAVLSHNRGTPNFAVRGAVDDARFTGLAEQLVHVLVELDDFTIEPAELADAEAFWASRRPSESFVPALDVSVRELQDAEEIGVDDVASVGAKAANFGELRNVEGVSSLVPEGFAIPVVHYVEHVERAGIDEMIADLVADESLLEDLAARRARLAQIRDAIRSADVDPALLEAVDARIREAHPDLPSMRFRSSSNAEDLAGFNGAGLYDSESGDLDDSDRPIADAIRVVWASLWNDRAFEERDWYRIDHLACAMGVLVHPGHPAEKANGVAITTNPFSRGRPAYFVNAQIGEVSVVASQAVPEQFLYYTWYPDPEIEYLSRSDIVEGDVLSPDEIESLADALEAIHDHFGPIYGAVESFGTGYGMDVEWKLDGQDRHLVIKQARPYYAQYE